MHEPTERPESEPVTVRSTVVLELTCAGCGRRIAAWTEAVLHAGGRDPVQHPTRAFHPACWDAARQA